MSNKPEVEGLRGCTDHSCIFGHPGGMGTNGGCHCLDAIRPLELRRKIMRNIQLLRAEIARLNGAYEKIGVLREGDGGFTTYDGCKGEPVFVMRSAK